MTCISMKIKCLLSVGGWGHFNTKKINLLFNLKVKRRMKNRKNLKLKII